MNELLGQPRMLPTTQAAEGLPRLRWSNADLDRLIDAGVLTEADRVELIGGELVPMAAKGNRHENVKIILTNWMYRRLPDGLLLAVELGWRPNQDTYLEPDILIFNNVAEPSRVAPSDVLLAVEIAASSFGYDVGRKSQVYAELGIKDYWVIDAQTLAARVFREPSGAGYQSFVEVPADGALVPLLVAPLALKLADLKIG